MAGRAGCIAAARRLAIDKEGVLVPVWDARGDWIAPAERHQAMQSAVLNPAAASWHVLHARSPCSCAGT
eukprot:365584-Chlamydomonas_euryale.AAC.14